MSLEGHDMDTISPRRSCSERIKPKRKATTATSVQCDRNNEIGRLKGTTSPISMLPDELVIEILSRLPPKTFFCCRSVCKYWQSISSDAFRRNMHLQPTVIGLFYNNNSSIASFSYLSCGANKVESVDGRISALRRYLTSVEVLDCCNGLVLVSALSQSKSQPFIKVIYVYNPATESLSALMPLSKFRNGEHSCFSLAVDNHDPSLLHLICFTRFIKKDVMFDRVDIFSFEEGKYKCEHEKELAPDMMVKHKSKGTFLDGKVHRITTQNKKILSIDPNDCSLQVIHLSDTKNLNISLVEIGQSQGLLHCMYVCEYKILYIWVLKSYSRQEWTMKHQLSLIHQIYDPVTQPNLNIIDNCYRIEYVGNFSFHPLEDVIFMPLGRSCLLKFDLSSSKREELNNLGDFGLSGFWLYMPFYSIGMTHS